MTRTSRLGIVCASLVLLSSQSAWAVPQAQDAVKAATGTTEQVAAAVKESPDLVNALSKEIGGTPEQAAGAAGALFGLAKSRLSADDFAQVAKAVPGMTSLLSAAPAAGAVGTSGVAGAAGALSSAAGSAGGLASAASAFSSLGLKPDMVAKAVPMLTQMVSKSGGASVGNLLAGALK